MKQDYVFCVFCNVLPIEQKMDIPALTLHAEISEVPISDDA